MFSKTTLANGLRVVTVPMESVKSVTVLVMVATGSRYEGQRINGVSHFLEHMIFKGTKKRPSSFAISSTIDGIGGSFNAFTGKEYTGFYVKAAAKHLELVLDVLSDMLLNSLYDQEEFDRERGVIIEEINMHEDDPGSKVGDLFERVLFGGHPLGRKISGEKGNIENLARSDVVNYLSDNYKSQAIVVGLAGNFDKNLVSGYFVRVPKGKENTFEPFKVSQNTPRVTVGYKKTDQANIVLGVPSYFLGHPDRYVLSVLGNILGGTMSSRLFTQVRVKRGLAYTIIAGSEEFHDTGFFAVSAGLRLFSLEEAIKVILGELDLIRAKPVDATELARAKDYFAGRMLLSLEDSYRTAMFYTVQELLEKKVETPEEVLAMVEKVTVEDIQRVAKDIFVNQKLNLAVVGPFKDESKFEKILKL